MWGKSGSFGELVVKHPWPLLEISLSDFRRLATLNIITYLPTYLPTCLPTYLPTYLPTWTFRQNFEKSSFFCSFDRSSSYFSCALFTVSVIHSEILRLQCKSFANYTINKNNSALQGSLIRTLVFRTDEECRFACMMDLHCKSYNKEVEGSGRCELNDKTTEIEEDNAMLVNRSGWIFKSTNYSDPLVRIHII